MPAPVERVHISEHIHPGVDAYVNWFQLGRERELILKPYFPDVACRVLRGKKPADFQTLTHKPEIRKIVFMGGPELTNSLIGLPFNALLLHLAYPQEFIDSELDGGTQFKLLVSPLSAVESQWQPATWFNLCDMALKVYPEWTDEIKYAQHFLTYADIKNNEAARSKVLHFFTDMLGVNSQYVGDGLTQGFPELSIPRFREFAIFNPPHHPPGSVLIDL